MAHYSTVEITQKPPSRCKMHSDKESTHEMREYSWPVNVKGFYSTKDNCINRSQILYPNMFG